MHCLGWCHIMTPVGRNLFDPMISWPPLSPPWDVNFLTISAQVPCCRVGRRFLLDLEVAVITWLLLTRPVWKFCWLGSNGVNGCCWNAAKFPELFQKLFLCDGNFRLESCLTERWNLICQTKTRPCSVISGVHHGLVCRLQTFLGFHIVLFCDVSWSIFSLDHQVR